MKHQMKPDESNFRHLNKKIKIIESESDKKDINKKRNRIIYVFSTLAAVVVVSLATVIIGKSFHKLDTIKPGSDAIDITVSENNLSSPEVKGDKSDISNNSQQEDSTSYSHSVLALNNDTTLKNDSSALDNISTDEVSVPQTEVANATLNSVQSTIENSEASSTNSIQTVQEWVNQKIDYTMDVITIQKTTSPQVEKTITDKTAIKEIIEIINDCSMMEINEIPPPGTLFTIKELSFGCTNGYVSYNGKWYKPADANISSDILQIYDNANAKEEAVVSAN